MTKKVSREIVRKTMQSVKSKNTKLEKQIFKILWSKGFRFSKNVKDLYGKPDIAIKKYQIVIFIDSCFWHGCEFHCRYPKNNIEFWQKKLRANIERDIKVTNYYKEMNWNILRVWEHELIDNFDLTINKIVDFIDTNRIKPNKQECI